jgi:hypothetical protein
MQSTRGIVSSAPFTTSRLQRCSSRNCPARIRREMAPPILRSGRSPSERLSSSVGPNWVPVWAWVQWMKRGYYISSTVRVGRYVGRVSLRARFHSVRPSRRADPLGEDAPTRLVNLCSAPVIVRAVPVARPPAECATHPSAFLRPSSRSKLLLAQQQLGTRSHHLQRSRLDPCKHRVRDRWFDDRCTTGCWSYEARCSVWVAAHTCHG